MLWLQLFGGSSTLWQTPSCIPLTEGSTNRCLTTETAYSDSTVGAVLVSSNRACHLSCWKNTSLRKAQFPNQSLPTSLLFRGSISQSLTSVRLRKTHTSCDISEQQMEVYKAPNPDSFTGPDSLCSCIPRGHVPGLLRSILSEFDSRGAALQLILSSWFSTFDYQNFKDILFAEKEVI